MGSSIFKKTQEELTALGAVFTAQEIAQQPELWLETLQIYEEHRASIEAFLAKVTADGAARTRVIFTGAGTSDYVGDMVAPYLRRVGDSKRWDFSSIATTDIVSVPTDMLNAKDPTLLVSFARSGNSPESLAALTCVRSVVDTCSFLTITCAPDGKLALEGRSCDDTLTLLIPAANDRGFAMTASCTCMALLALLIFDSSPLECKRAYVEMIADMGRTVLAREDEICDFVNLDFDRITYLGSGSYYGLAQEAQLKVLELASGQTATSFDTSMGYRHGPKSFVNAHTIVFVFVSDESYTRQYDLDILREIAHDGRTCKVVAIQTTAGPLFEGASFTFETKSALGEGYLALPFCMVAQTVGLLNSIKIGNTPDTPCADGSVNRVVKGVTIYPLEIEHTV